MKLTAEEARALVSNETYADDQYIEKTFAQIIDPLILHALATNATTTSVALSEFPMDVINGIVDELEVNGYHVSLRETYDANGNLLASDQVIWISWA